MLIWILVVALFLTGASIAGIYAQIKRETEKRISRIRLKQIAGNVTDQETEWMQKIATSRMYRKRNDLARWRPHENQILDRYKKKLKQKIKQNTKTFKEIAEENNKKTEYYPRHDQFLSFRQVDANLQKDKLAAVSCIDGECGELNETSNQD
jgi:hypothetical protein